MCRELKYKHRHGFLIPVAMILVVGIAVMALALSRMSSQSGVAAVQEALSVQTFYAAESGAYYGMNRLMFNVSDRSVADANCDALTATVSFAAAGMNTCSAVVTCTRASVMGNPQSFYTVRSDASCGSGDLFAERIVEVSSYL